MGTASKSIPDIASSVRDTGRRGNPRPGCDCEQCFGYCQVDQMQAVRETIGIRPGRENAWLKDERKG